MKKLNENRLCGKIGALLGTASLLTVSAFAAEGADFANVYQPIVALLNSIMTPLLAIVVAVGALYCVLLGIKYAQAEEPQEREKAKTHLKNAVIGYVLIFVLILALNQLTPVMKNWVWANSGIVIGS